MRKKKKAIKRSYQDLNFDDFKWCVENDFQVYIHPISEQKRYPDGRKYHQLTGQFKIAVRRNGILTKGKDVHRDEYGRVFESVVTLSKMTFNNDLDAHNHLNYTYKYLRDKYGGGS